MDIVSKINGNQVSATEFNQIPTELEALITSSGQIVSDAILNQDSIAVSRYAANNFYIDSGTANAYVLTLASSMTNPVSATVGYFVGMTIRFRAGNANTGASTVNVNSAGVKNLKQAEGTTDLALGDIPTTQDSIFRYNGTAFCLANGSASETAKGIAEIATQAEVNTGTDDVRYITPLKLQTAFNNNNFIAAAIRFDASASPTTLASKNISGLTRLGPGNYRLNFTTAMPNANYYVTAVCAFTNYTPTIGIVSALTTSLEIQCQKWDSASFTSNPDLSNISILIFKS